MLGYGFATSPTLRREDCARRWTKPASKASALGGQREPLGGAHKGASLFPNPKGGGQFFASGPMCRAGRKNDHSFKSEHLNGEFMCCRMVRSVRSLRSGRFSIPVPTTAWVFRASAWLPGVH